MYIQYIYFKNIFIIIYFFIFLGCLELTSQTAAARNNHHPRHLHTSHHHRQTLSIKNSAEYPVHFAGRVAVASSAGQYPARTVVLPLRLDTAAPLLAVSDTSDGTPSGGQMLDYFLGDHLPEKGLCVAD